MFGFVNFQDDYFLEFSFSLIQYLDDCDSNKELQRQFYMFTFFGCSVFVKRRRKTLIIGYESKNYPNRLFENELNKSDLV